jgi:hypothetical protein
VPLDREYSVFPVLDHLDEAILSPARWVEVIPDDLDSLVVDRVHVELFGIDDFCKQRFGFEENTVDRFVASARLGVVDAFGGGEVLAERPAEGDVHQLGASTDPEDGNPTFDGGGNEGKLTSIPLVVDVGSLPFESRAVTRRRNIAAADEQQSVDAPDRALRQLGRCGRDEQWQSSRPENRRHVLMRRGVELPSDTCLSTDGDPDPGLLAHDCRPVRRRFMPDLTTMSVVCSRIPVVRHALASAVGSRTEFHDRGR